MIHYRGFIIDICYEYAGGKMDGYYCHDNAESGPAFYRQTLAQVKDDIDTLIFEGTTIRVKRNLDSHRYTITKFDWLKEATEFAAKVNGEIQMIYNGQAHNIESI